MFIQSCRFLTTFKRFVSRGFPRHIYSDSGTQLVAADKELRELIRQWDLSKVWNSGSDEGMEWSFNKSADAPVKRLICLSVGSNVLIFSELQSVLYEIANLVNERPIGIKPGCNLDMGTYLCPNDLLLEELQIRYLLVTGTIHIIQEGDWNSCRVFFLVSGRNG